MSRYGCHNRAEFKPMTPVQDGWYMDGHTRTPRMVAMPHRMEKSCQYQHTELGQRDRRCTGCARRDQPITELQPEPRREP